MDREFGRWTVGVGIGLSAVGLYLEVSNHHGLIYVGPLVLSWDRPVLKDD